MTPHKTLRKEIEKLPLHKREDWSAYQYIDPPDTLKVIEKINEIIDRINSHYENKV